MADRKRKPGTIIHRLHALISEARKATARPNSQPAISSIMLGRPSFVRKIGRTRGLRMHLVAIGLASEVRRFLKIDSDEGDELWPARLRKAVEDIGEARVFVPSRGEFVLLAPMTITRVEVKEAGNYLIDKGNDCINRGNSLLNLATMMAR
jgi:hypothetical protein